VFLPVLPQLAFAESSQELKADEIFHRQAYLWLSAKNYQALEQAYQRYLDLYARNEITAEELSMRFDAFTKTRSLDLRFDEWVEAFPKSYSARLARGIFLITTAWEKRGNKFANVTTDEQFRGFLDFSKEAQADLFSSLKLYGRPVESYRYLIRISKGIGGGNERDLLDAALKLDPKALNPRREYLTSIVPKWGGSKKLMTSFIEESKQSPMNARNKNHLEEQYFDLMADDAQFEKDYLSASIYFNKSYQLNNLPNKLESSAQAAQSGEFFDLAFARFNLLVIAHPLYLYGYQQRGYLYETHLKDIDSALKDYLTAADLGCDWAQNRLGWFYMMGENVPVDYVKAKYYLDLAAAQGNSTAKANLNVLNDLLSQSGK
jgi:hypothetical protein